MKKPQLHDSHDFEVLCCTGGEQQDLSGLFLRLKNLLVEN